MLGGDADREVSRAHARELLERGSEEVGDVTPLGDADASPTPKRAGQRRGKPV
ncbi:MAG: hypothetical protein ACK559_41815 [bacterium]